MSRSVDIQGLTIGGGAPVRVESMLKVPLSDIEECIKQCERLRNCGCELARVALPEASLAKNLGELIRRTELRLMADIHFDPDIAIAAMREGCASVRINPGNMSVIKLSEMIKTARDFRTVIRIGANGGSIGNRQLELAKGDRALALFYAVAEQADMLLKNDFTSDIIISAKSSNLPETVRANALLSKRYDFPIHIGITEAGFGTEGLVKGAAGISLILAQGIGDTLRVSLTEEPENEVKAGYAILKALELRQRGVRIVSCPTCGRRRVDVKTLTGALEPLINSLGLPDGTTIAVMGCEVNGPREAMHADFGIAGTPNGAAVFRGGEIIGNFSIQDLERELPKLFFKKDI